ncbi:MAG: hypothetical protein V1776_01020 [Candidatus Diapherotrites archaeon]
MRAPLILFTLLLLVILPGLVSAKIVCKTSDSISDGIVVVKLSAPTNAHAETYNYSGGIYPIKIRCKEDTGVSLDNGIAGSVTLMQLSTITNAHAQTNGSGGTYTINVNVGESEGGNLEVQTVTAPLNCSNLGTEWDDVVHLSGTTNAHLEAPEQSNYSIYLCLRYDSGGVPVEPTENIVSVKIPNKTGILTSINDNEELSIPINLKKEAINSLNINTREIIIASVCNLDISSCQTATDFQKYLVGIINDGTSPTWSGTVFTNRKGTAYGIYTLISPLTNIPINLNDIIRIESSPGVYAANIEALGGIYNYFYIVNPTTMSLSPGNYRFHAVGLWGEYDYSGGTSNKAETQAYANSDNFDYFDFEIKDSSGPGPGGPDGTGGDIFSIKDISFVPNPPIEGGNIVANITILNKQTDITATNATILNVVIRDGDGNPIPGTPNDYFTQQQITFDSVFPEKTIPIQISTAGIADAFAPGETFTLYASIDPYVESPPVGEKDDSETITGNNSAFRTFTVVNPQRAISVPDAPWWMALVVVGIVLGWMFVSTRSTKTLRGRRGKFAFDK